MSQKKMNISRRMSMVAGGMVLLLVFLITRLFYIQVIEGKDFAYRAANQRMLDLPLDISRGQIYDRNMIPLTGRNTDNNLVVFPALIEDKIKAAHLIADITSLSYGEILDKLNNETVPFKIPGVRTSGGAADNSVRGIMPVKDIIRYDEDSLARHLVGYIDKKDRVGRAGVEKLYHYYLSGKQEVAVAAMVDGSSRVIPGLGYKLVTKEVDIKNYNIQLTIDYHIQKKVEEVIDRYGMDGAVVVLDVNSGEILAMASRPNYRQDKVEDYLEGYRGELLNKALQQYNLGSIFKTVVAVVILERNLVSPFEKINCPGYAEVGGIQFKCSAFDKGGHGEIALYDAYAQSCNTFFIEMGKRAGGKAIIDMAESFGYNSIIGVNPYEEHTGALPDPEDIYTTDIGNISIGQGDILVTPLQVADTTNTIANSGVRKKPFVFKALVDNKGNSVKLQNEEEAERIISPFVAMEIRKMMDKVVKEGTGKKADLPEWGGAAGKTSSAQTGQKLGEEEVVHAWFTGYVPCVRPRYVITVLVENGKSGGGVAAPIFRDIAREIMELGSRY